MKIAVDVLSIREDGSAGGATGFALELIKGFASTPDVQVVVLCAEWNVELLKKILPKNIQFVQVVGQAKYTGIGRIDRLLNRIMQKAKSDSVLRDNQVDILYCPFSAASFKERGIPTVSTILDIQHEFYPQFFTPQELQHRRKFYQDIVKKVERVVCISDYTKDTFCEKYSYPRERAQTIYIAIQNRLKEQDDNILDKLNIKGQKYIVYPANFWEHKNHKLLLNAFAMYANEHRDLKLVLTGNPLEQADYYKQLMKVMKIDDLVSITGYISNEELCSILKNAKGLIYPSLFEGFGIPVVEAMHLHKLIACSDLTSLPEIGCEGIFYFNPKKPDEIRKGIEFLADGEMTNEIVTAYIEKLKEYETDKMVNEYLRVFEEVIDKKEEISFQEEVTGIYPDGWSSEEIVIRVKDKVGGKIQGKLTLPEFVKMKITVTVEQDEKKKSITLTQGQSYNLYEEITRNQTELIIKFPKTWSPKDVLKSEDVRKLAVMVEELKLTQDNVVTDLKQSSN